MQKVSPIKQRILQYVDIQRISKREFYAKTGISRGTLENPTGITEETLAKFIAIYQNISPYWLLFGTGPVEIEKKDRPTQVGETEAIYGQCRQCQLRDEIIKEKSKVIRLLEDKIGYLDNEKSSSDGDIRQTG